MLRFHPLVQKIKAIIDSKELGPVYSARFEFGSYLPDWHPWEDHRTSYASRKELGGGVINTITHELDLIQYYFGEPISVQCTKATFGKLSIETEEIAEACFEYKDKLVTLHLDYLQKDYDRNIKILCDEGKIVWNWHENLVRVTRHKGEERMYTLKDFDVNQLYIDELKDFIGLIKSSNSSVKHPLDFAHAQTNTSLMLLMHTAAEQKSSKTLQTLTGIHEIS
jgi:predicted dehydrogenase